MAWPSRTLAADCMAIALGVLLGIPPIAIHWRISPMLASVGMGLAYITLVISFLLWVRTLRSGLR